MAALEIVSLDTATPQLRAPASGDTYAAPRAVALLPETLTGAAATSSLSIVQTWNTTGTPTALDLNVTDTASNASSLLMNLRVGGVSRFSVTKAGRAEIAAINLGGGSYAGDANWWSPNNLNVASASALSFGSADLVLRRDAANTLAQRNGVNAQAFNIYNTYTDASNYERGFVRWSSNVMQIGAEAAGTGASRLTEIRSGLQLDVYTYGSRKIRVGSTSINLSADLIAGAYYTELAEMTAPAAPAADRVRIYAEDNGSGKTRLMALFATGAAQQIAIEP